jgi:hypothetical protein
MENIRELILKLLLKQAKTKPLSGNPASVRETGDVSGGAGRCKKGGGNHATFSS